MKIINNFKFICNKVSPGKSKNSFHLFANKFNKFCFKTKDNNSFDINNTLTKTVNSNV